uniref:Nucleoporin Nup133/Nup155-like N-terminal domain-containing protein n=1 Tax=Panagrolaimus sp. JU765 TaxID=591449 RepID=A0AC34Q2Q1_9BILA
TPSDVPVVHDIVGTENGRIFFTSGTRHLLYALGERGSIQSIDLGADGTKTDKSKILSIDEIRKEIRGSCGVEDEFLAAIKFIKAIPSTKSQIFTLEAITSKSLRIYLTVYNDRINYPGGIDQDSVRAQTLRVVHVRYPPTNVYGLHSGNHIYTAFVDTESTLVAQMPDDGSTTLNIYSSSSFEYTESHRMESYADFLFSGSIWSFARLPADPKPPTVPGLIAPVMPPWVVREHLNSTQKIFTLS